MAIVAKLPEDTSDHSWPVYRVTRCGFWQRWNKQTSLVVFIIGVGAVWMAISLLLVFEIQ
jgi:hypothetical protein